MPRPSWFRPFLFALLVALLAAGSPARSGEPKSSRADFSGAWTLKEETADKPSPVPATGEEGTLGAGTGGSRRGRSSGGERGNGISGLPLEAVGDVTRLTITDDGFAVRVERPTGRQRVLITDGEERELDDDDGPAKVVAKRKGARGETISVSASWSGGSRLTEVWEVGESPRRLTVTGKVSGLTTYRFRRVYEPAPLPAPPSATSPVSPPAAAPPAPAAAAAPTAAPPGAPAGPRPECSIRPPRGTDPTDLRRMAKISSSDAASRAVASVAPKKVAGVISSDPEIDDGCLVWPFDLRLEGEKGVLEVLIDAGDGKVLSSRHPDD